MSNQTQPYTKASTEGKPNLVSVCFNDFIRAEFPVKEPFLGHWLTSQSIAMIHAWRGVGKSHVALGIAYAISTGTSFLGWEAGKTPRKVLYIDGEMPAIDVQTRLKALAAMDPGDGPDTNMFRIMNGSLWEDQGLYMPDLATIEDQKLIDAHIGDAEVIIVDNISCLVRGNYNDNDPQNWEPVANWALGHRRRGKAIIFIHHSGKNGTQRGSSKKEDSFDIIIKFQHPGDYSPEQGAKFEVHFEKTGRSENLGDLSKPFEAWLKPEGWKIKDLECSLEEKILEYKEQGYETAEIMDLLKVSKFKISRAIKNSDLSERHSNQKSNGYDDKMWK